MRLRDTRLWALLIAIAFFALWCVSVGVLRSVPPQEPLPEPAPAATVPAAQWIGIAGWCLVAAGFLGVAMAVFLTGRQRRQQQKRRRLHAARLKPTVHTVYASPYIRRYRQQSPK